MQKTWKMGSLCKSFNIGRMYFTVGSVELLCGQTKQLASVSAGPVMWLVLMEEVEESLSVAHCIRLRGTHSTKITMSASSDVLPTYN